MRAVWASLMQKIDWFYFWHNGPHVQNDKSSFFLNLPFLNGDCPSKFLKVPLVSNNYYGTGKHI